MVPFPMAFRPPVHPLSPPFISLALALSFLFSSPLLSSSIVPDAPSASGIMKANRRPKYVPLRINIHIVSKEITHDTD